VAKDIIGAMRRACDELPSTECRGRSATEQRCGAPCAETLKGQNLGRLTTQKNGKYRAFLFATICVVRWNLNDCFQKGSRVMVECVDYEATVRLLARIFLKAMEMGGIAKRYPHAIFTIGGCASAPE
jgi:hypothetical protein